MIVLSAAISHADWIEQRRIWAREIQRAVPGAVLVRDTKRNLWDTTKRTWHQALRKRNVTHVVAMQDDMLPCPNFLSLLYGALEARPAAIVCYFSMRQALLTAQAQGISWLYGPDCTWGGTTVLPSDLAIEFLLWERKNIDPMFKSADRRLVLFCREHGLPVYVTAPSLVQHEGAEQSLIGHPAKVGNLTRRSPWVSDGSFVAWDTTGVLRLSGTVKFSAEMEKARRKFSISEVKDPQREVEGQIEQELQKLEDDAGKGSQPT